MKKYPILYKYLSEEKGDVKKLELHANFNDFSHYMIDYYSFNISREKAKEKMNPCLKKFHSKEDLTTLLLFGIKSKVNASNINIILLWKKIIN